MPCDNWHIIDRAVAGFQLLTVELVYFAIRLTLAYKGGHIAKVTPPLTDFYLTLAYIVA